MLLWFAILVTSTLAFGISAVSGGGAGLILMPLLELVLPDMQVPAALSIGTATSSAARIISFHKAIRWDIVRHFAPTALPFSALGAWALSLMNPVYLSLLLGLFLVGNLPLLFRTPPIQPKRKPVRVASLHALGAAAGFISGFTGAIGLVFNGFYYQLGLRKEEVVATRAANEIMLHGLKLILYAAFGLMSIHVVIVGIAVAAAAILSSIIMRHLLPYLHDRLFHHIGHAAMVVAGLMMVITAGGQIARQNAAVLNYSHASGDLSASLSWQQHIFVVEWEHGNELELIHRVYIPSTNLPGTPIFHGFILHMSPHTGIQTVRSVGV